MADKINNIKITKRDGRLKDFNTSRIRFVIDSASLEVGKYNENDTLGVDIAEYIEDYLVDNHIECIGVEEVQDLVIERLEIEDKEVAKAYKKYRKEREKQRNHPIDKQILELLEGTNELLAKENANKNASLLSTQRDLMAGTISRNLALRYKIPKELADAHNEGLIKLHDLDYF